MQSRKPISWPIGFEIWNYPNVTHASTNELQPAGTRKSGEGKQADVAGSK
jgi:hypothetical protein